MLSALPPLFPKQLPVSLLLLRQDLLLQVRVLVDVLVRELVDDEVRVVFHYESGIDGRGGLFLGLD